MEPGSLCQNLRMGDKTTARVATRSTWKGGLLRLALMLLAVQVLNLISDDVVLPLVFAVIALALSAAAVFLLPVIVANRLCDSYDAWQRSRTP